MPNTADEMRIVHIEKGLVTPYNQTKKHKKLKKIRPTLADLKNITTFASLLKH